MQTAKPKKDQIFNIAVAIQDPTMRVAYLDDACGDDHSLRNEVEGLLQHDQEGASFLESPPAAIRGIGVSPVLPVPGGAGVSPAITLDEPSVIPGTTIGPYKLLEQIGEGGFGVVFMAEQTEPVRRKVALKLLKPGMDTRQVVARFEAERQALAIMDHPNIAKVLDAGTVGGTRDERLGTREGSQTLSSLAPSPQPLATSARPYFVMELVRGIPINEFCDQQKLDVRRRLDLFIDVCQAVQHAHQKGLIHRDLKPSNVLVSRHDTTPIVKIIDFGVAKALGQSLTDKTLFTGIAQMIGTPLYMSPEQAGMSDLDVDTRSDIYSLGVLLYELLTGTTPFDKDRLKSATFDEMRRIIREEEPETVSQRLARTRRVGQGPGTAAKRWSAADGPPCNPPIGGPALAGSLVPPYNSLAPSHQPLAPRLSELDWIVMKALEKDRSRRYESASALAADIQRYLNDEPVLACPPTTMYRFQKFARKHQPSLITAAAIAVCLLLGTTVSAWQAVRATQAEAQASANAQKALANEQQALANAATAQEKEQEAIQQRDEVKALADKLAAKEQQLQRTLYAAHMNLAHNAFEAGAPARIRELLAQHRPQPGEADLRGFEWHYLNRLYPADLLALRHSGQVTCVTYGPDGKRVATISGPWQNGILTVWDAQTGDKLISQPAAAAATATFSPDGKRVATSGKIWDAETGQELLSLSVGPGPGPGFGVAFSPDGKRLATVTGSRTSNQIAISDAHTGERLLTLEGHTNQLRGLAFSPDGKRLASASVDKTIKLWDAENGQIVHTLEGHTDSVFGLAYSPDGKRVASASVDKTLKLWDPLSGDGIRTLRGHTSTVYCAAFSPDGKRLASASNDSTVKVWDVESGDELFAFQGHTRGVWSVAFSPDGRRLASASVDGTVKVREAKAVQKAIVLGGGAGDVAKVAFSSDGKRLTSVDGGHAGTDPSLRKAQVWDTQTGQKLLTIDVLPGSVALSLNGRHLAGSSSKQREGQKVPVSETNIWDLESGKKVNTTPIDDRRYGYSKRGNVITPFTPQCALSPDGKQLFTRRTRASFTGVRVWDVQTGQEIRSFKGPASNIVFSPDGRRLAGAAEDGTSRIWDARTGDEILSFRDKASSFGSRVGVVAFSHDGKRIACNSGDLTVGMVWDAETGDELLSLKGHSGLITMVAFSPDDKRLATASSDATIKIWDSQTGQELLTLAGSPNGPVNGVAFSPDGHRLAAGGPNGAILIYDATPLPEKP